jgi:hypothetical protein
LLPLRAAEHVATTPASRDSEGEALARELTSQRPAKPIDFNGEFHIRKPDGKRLDAPVLYSFEVRGDEWEDHYRSSASATQGSEDLQVVHRPDQPNQYIFTQLSPDGTRTNRMTLAGAEAAVSFAGSDFWLTDLGLEFLHWRQQRLVRDAKITMRLGRPCKVLESTSNGEGAYSRVVSWIDSEFGSIIYAEAYDSQNKHFKVFSLKGFKKIDGRWHVRELELRNDKADSRTRLEFNLNQE